LSTTKMETKRNVLASYSFFGRENYGGLDLIL
jgi:hypothetical protein